MRFSDSVLAEHLPDYKLGITADQILTGGASFFVFLAQMLEKHDEALIFRDIVASQGSIWARKVLHVPDKRLVADDEGGTHSSLLIELIAGTGSVEETKDAVFGHEPALLRLERVIPPPRYDS